MEGKTYCQDFPVGRGYAIAFLERNPLNENDTKTFIPADFVEMSVESNVTDELLANTCGLHQLLPFNVSASITDECPAVSTDFKCTSNKINIHLPVNGSGLYPVVIPGGAQNGMDNIRSKSGATQVEADVKNGVNAINISTLLIFMAVLFGRWN